MLDIARWMADGSVFQCDHASLEVLSAISSVLITPVVMWEVINVVCKSFPESGLEEIMICCQLSSL